MEQFKAVEKEMKTKAYSKEGLSAAQRLDPKEKERVECSEFLSNMVDELQLKIESLEAEEETLHAQMKKGKKDTKKAERMGDISHTTERHKWHVNKLEFLNRSLQNGNLDVNAVQDLKESIKYYVEEGGTPDYSGEDETLYDDLNIGEEVEAVFGMGGEGDRVSSQDAQSVQDEEPEPKPKAKPEAPAPRRPSTQMKSPLPVLATLHPAASSSATPGMKPAPLPTRPPGETLKYASAAAAAAASDKSGVGILPLPPPPGLSPALSVVMPTKSSTASPSVTPAQPVPKSIIPPAVSAFSEDLGAPSRTPASSSPAPTKVESTANGKTETKGESEESVYHLPPGLQDLVQSFEVTKTRASAKPSKSASRLLATSLTTCPEANDAEKPRHYRPQNPYSTPLYYPQEPLSIFDDPRLYDTGRIDTDTLFYLFYYRQGTYQQYLAAKALRNQSWRFHKQYQTWFQRHEEPKNITEEFEQGTYRFFDYESTWSVVNFRPTQHQIDELTAYGL
jgi:CCR4-NOT transcription complex subunit 3